MYLCLLLLILFSVLLFFFKQKTAYEMRISDWSSDVCSSDLLREDNADLRLTEQGFELGVVPQARVDALRRRRKRVDHKLRRPGNCWLPRTIPRAASSRAKHAIRSTAWTSSTDRLRRRYVRGSER